EDSQIIGSDDTVMLGGSCPRPYRNVVVCATGVLDKIRLSRTRRRTSVNAFTDRVTHLIAKNHGGAKYLMRELLYCALERKIPIMLPSWIIDSHRIWRHDDDDDLDQLSTFSIPYINIFNRAEYRCPPPGRLLRRHPLHFWHRRNCMSH
ncbi:hypothetical protein C8R43DRAFT_1052981, partial [Mycena crocata]